MKLACVFPGQGSQSIGMMSELAELHPEVKDLFSRASKVLGYDLWKLVSDGPVEELNKTECTQPAMLTAGVAAWKIVKKSTDIQPVVIAGHSLGEYTALVCSGAIDFEDAVKKCIKIKDKVKPDKIIQKKYKKIFSLYTNVLDKHQDLPWV